jgi:superfamily II DNA or RNA helicase
VKIAKRDYQVRAVKELPGLLKKHRRVVAVSPTSSGKTVIGAALVRKMRGKRVLWLAHRHELIDQAVEHLIEAGIPRKAVGVLNGHEKSNTKARILVASVHMFCGEHLVPDADLIVIDEAHHVAASSYRYILDVRPKALVLGLTATPWRLDGEPLGDVFAYLHVIAEAVELIAEGYIMQSKVYACVDHATAKAMTRGLSTGGGDWSKKKLEGRMRTAKLMGDVVSEWKRLADGQPTLLFATTVEHANDMAGRFLAAGITAETVSWETPGKERKAILARLKSGATLVVCNVAVFTEGLDCPPVKCIILARPTKSLTLYRQMVGRGGRPHGKRKPVVLDHAGNVWRLRLPDEPIEWSLHGGVQLGGDAPVKKCPACEAMIHIAARECPHCGAEQPIAERDPEDRDAELKRVRAAAEAEKKREELIRRLAAAKGLGERWVTRALREQAA